MINSEHPAGTTEDVATLAVGVVDQHVENGEQPKISDIGMDHRDRVIVRVEAFHGCEPALLGHGRAWHKINELVGCCLIDFDPDLKRSGTERPVEQHRNRHAVETTDPRYLVCSHLPKAESTVRKVPERPLSIRLQLGQEGGIRRLQQTAGDLQFGLPELCRQCRMGRPSVILAQATKIVDSQSESIKQRPTIAVGAWANVPLRIDRL